MNSVVLVTGATGNVGRWVVTGLRARGLRARPGLRDPAGDPDAVAFDFRRPETFAPALAGSSALFLLRPPAIADVERTLHPLVDAAIAAGVRRIVFLSVIGADTRGYIPHAKVEQHLRRGPSEWTFLRAGFFAQNLGDAYRIDIREHDELFVPAGRGRAAFVDARDLADAAVRLLADDGHARRAYTATGPQALGFAEVAALLSAELGRQIRYTRPGALRYALRLRRRGLPSMQVLVQTLLHVGLRFGQAELVDPTLPALLGRPARTLAHYIADYRGLWLR